MGRAETALGPRAPGGERLVERLAVLEQDSDAVSPVLLRRRSALPLQLVAKPVETAPKLHRHGGREPGIPLNSSKHQDAHRRDPSSDLGAALPQRTREQQVEQLRGRRHARVGRMLSLEAVQALGRKQ